MPRDTLAGTSMYGILQLFLIAALVQGEAFGSGTPLSGAYKNCGEEGIGGDSMLNRLKNRSDQVASPQPIVAAAVQKLPVPVPPNGRGYPHRSAWGPDALEVLVKPEATGVSFEGILIAVKQQKQEASNCERADLNDYHIWIAPPGQQFKAKGMVVEETPRWKGVNPARSLTALRKLATRRARVRITGWLLFDQEHPDEAGKSRATAWEIHPITKIEVITGRQYRELR